MHHLDNHGPWVLQLNNAIFCFKLKTHKITPSFHKASYTKPAIVLFENKHVANKFKNEHLSMFMYNNNLIETVELDDPNISKVNIHVPKTEHKRFAVTNFLTKSTLDNPELYPVMLSSFTNEQLVLFSIFTYAIYMYVTDISSFSNRIEINTIVLDPFTNTSFHNTLVHNNSYDSEATKFKHNIILNQLEQMYKKSESI